MRALSAAAAMTRSNEDEPRNLTDYESARHTAHLQQLIAESEQRTGERFAAFEKMFAESLGEIFGKERRKLRQETRRHLDEEVAKLRTGPQGARGERGEKGYVGARGPEGRAGPKGNPGDSIVAWKIDRARYLAVPQLSDGSLGPAIELRELFQQFVADLKK